MAELKTKIHLAITNMDRETLENVFKSMETQSNFVALEHERQFEDLMNQ